MAVRPNMQYIIDYVRELINDREPDGVFTDQQIQDRLDLSRRDVYAMELTPAQTLVQNGTSGIIEFHDFYGKFQFWEKDVLLQGMNAATLTPDDANYLLGRWHFIARVINLPVLITGKYYDVYGVAAKLLLQMASSLRTQFNFTVDGLTVDRMSQIRNLQQDATRYQSMAWGGSTSQIKLVRKDLQA